MKKKLNLLLAASMLATMITVPVHASETSATISRSGNVITATATADSATAYEYQWVERNSPQGEYVELPTDTNVTYNISPRDKNKYINCEVTPVYGNGDKGASFFATEDILISDLGIQNRTTDTFPNRQTPAEYKFTIKGYGREYILLDWFNDKDSAFFVMVDNPQFVSPFDTVSGHIKFDPACETNIGYLLNCEEYRTNGGISTENNAYPMDKNILNHINWNHVWWTERGLPSGEAPTDYSFTAGISVLSKSEGDKYRNKIGFDPRNNYTWWWSRTQRGNAGGTAEVMAMKQSAQMWPVNGVTGAEGQIPTVRPVFYLDENFFKEVKLTIFNDAGEDILGSDVKNMLVRKYTVADLENLYSDDELRTIGFDIPNRPEITTSGGNGYPVVLTANLTVDNAVSYNYQWVKRSTADGAYTEVRGDKNKTYSVSTLDKNEYINCRVTPVYADGSKGTTAMSKTDYYVENLGVYSRTNRTLHQFKETTPAENTFKVVGQQRQYIVLDEFNDAKSSFYIMDDFLYHQSAFDTANSPKFDPTSITNLGYVLNSEDFKANGLGSTLNPNIMNHIDWNHVWWTEQGHPGDIDADYSFTAGIAVPSITEMYKYIDKFGYNPNGSNTMWWTRTMRGKDGMANALLCGWTGGDTSGTPYNEFWPQYANLANIGVRTSYFLDEDFFREVKVYDVGENVKEIIRNRYNKSELSAIYDEAELAELGYEPSIIMEDAVGNLYHPDDLKVSVNYTPANSGAEVAVIAECNGKEQELYVDYPEEAVTEEFKISNVPFGTQTIKIYIEEDGTRMATLDKTVYVVPTVIADNGQNGLGTNFNLTLYHRDDVADYVKAVKELGFNDIRVEFTWRGRAEEVKGEYKIDYFKKLMDAAAANDINVTGLFAYNNPLYSSTKDDKEPIDTPEEREAFVNYVKAFVSAYPALKKIEIWNEPNGPGFWTSEAISNTDIANYTLLMKEVSAAVKEIAPNINVYAGAIDVSKDAENYINGMLDNGAYEYMDTLSYHPYFHPTNVDSVDANGFVNYRITPYKNILRNAGGFKSLVATEFGFSETLFASKGVEEQKREVPKAYIVMAANNIDSAEVFCYMDDEYGLLNSDGTPDKLMYSMAQLNHALNGTSFIGKLPTAAGTTAYVFERNGVPVIAAWSSNDAEFTVNGANAKAYDVYGNALTISNSKIALGLDPVYIENADIAYFAEASANEVQLRKTAITEYFADLPQNIAAAISSDSDDTKALIKASSLETVKKSALLDMLHEVETVQAAYAAIGSTDSVVIPTERYNAVKAAADNKYAKAAVKYAYEYIIQAENAVKAGAVSVAAKDAAIASELLDSAQALSTTEPAGTVTVSDVKKTNGVLTFNVTNTTNKNITVYVATYNGEVLNKVTIPDINNISVNVGDLNGKIFVWESNTMVPITNVIPF